MKQPTQKSSGKSKTPDRPTTFTFGTGRAYTDNEEFASKGLLFDILAIAFEPGQGFEGRDRWAVTVKVEDRDPEIMSLGSNPGRDEKLREAQANIERQGPIKGVRLRMSDKAYYIVDGAR